MITFGSSPSFPFFVRYLIIFFLFGYNMRYNLRWTLFDSLMGLFDLDILFSWNYLFHFIIWSSTEGFTCFLNVSLFMFTFCLLVLLSSILHGSSFDFASAVAIDDFLIVFLKSFLLPSCGFFWFLWENSWYIPGKRILEAVFFIVWRFLIWFRYKHFLLNKGT